MSGAPGLQGPTTVLCLTSGGCTWRGGGQGDWGLLWSRAAFWPSLLGVGSAFLLTTACKRALACSRGLVGATCWSLLLVRLKGLVRHGLAG